jgi:hypothetical protein
MEQRTFRPRLSLAPDPAGTLKKRLLSTPVLSDDIRGTWAGLSAGQLPPAIKHCVSFFHSTAHCTPGHQNLYAPTKKFAWPACQVSDLDVGCVALARPWFSTFQTFVPECAQQHHPLPLPSPWHRRAAWFVSLGHCANFGGGGCDGRACAHWCEQFSFSRCAQQHSTAPPHPLTPQGCLVSQSKVPCKVWGQGVRWAGLRTLVWTLVGIRQT